MSATLFLTLLIAVPPGLRADPPTVALGPVTAGRTLEASVTLTNATACPLTLLDPLPGCGCQRWSLPARTLAPGTSATATVTITTLAQAPGPARWRMRFPTRLPDGTPGPAADAEWTATVRRTLVVEPAAVSVTAGTPHAPVLRVTRVAGPPPRVTSPDAGVRVEHTREAVLVRLTLDPTPGERTVTLHTDDPELPTLTVPVEVRAAPAAGVRVVPESADFVGGTSAGPQSRLFQARPPVSGGTLAVDGWSCDSPAVSVRQAPGALPVVPLRVTFDPAQAPASGEATVEVRWADAAAGATRVRVVWKAP